MWHRDYEACSICSLVGHSTETCPNMQYQSYFDQSSMFGGYQANQGHWNDQYAPPYNPAWNYPPYFEWNDYSNVQQGSFNDFEASSLSYHDYQTPTPQGDSLEDLVASMTKNVSSFSQIVDSCIQDMKTCRQNINESVENIGQHVETILACLNEDSKEQEPSQEASTNEDDDWPVVDEILETMAPGRPPDYSLPHSISTHVPSLHSALAFVDHVEMVICEHLKSNEEILLSMLGGFKKRRRQWKKRKKKKSIKSYLSIAPKIPKLLSRDHETSLKRVKHLVEPRPKPPDYS